MFSPRSTPSPWRAKLERAADVVVAFATLESVTSVRELIGGEPAPAPPAHPHRRRPLQAPVRSGRPGAVAAREHACTTAPAMRSRSRDARRVLH